MIYVVWQKWEPMANHRGYLHRKNANRNMNIWWWYSCAHCWISSDLHAWIMNQWHILDSICKHKLTLSTTEKDWGPQNIHQLGDSNPQDWWFPWVASCGYYSEPRHHQLRQASLWKSMKAKNYVSASCFWDYLFKPIQPIIGTLG